MRNQFYLMFPVDFENGHLRIAIAAPTGMAAKGVGGNTIHSLLSMDVTFGGEAEYTALRDDTLMKMRHLFLGGDILTEKDLDDPKIRKKRPLLIIDEISMVSNIMLAKIHLRCCEITGERNLRKPYFLFT